MRAELNSATREPMRATACRIAMAIIASARGGTSPPGSGPLSASTVRPSSHGMARANALVATSMSAPVTRRAR